MATVYEIQNLVNDKVYIGSTTREPEDRKCEHWTLLRNGRHHNQHLQAAWNLYGKDAFRFTPVLTLDCSEAEIRDIETQYIRQARVELGRENVYTMRDGSKSPLSNPEVRERHLTATAGDPEWCAATAERNRRAPEDPEWRAAHARGIERRASNQEWRARKTEASRRCAADPAWLKAHADRMHKMSESKEWQEHHAEAMRRRQQTEEWVAKRSAAAAEKCAKDYVFLSPAGEVIAVHNLRAFCRQEGLDPGAMLRVHAGKQAQHKGYRRYGP